MRVGWALAPVALGACGGSAASGVSDAAADYAGPEGRVLVYNPVSAHAASDTGGGSDTGPSDTGASDTGTDTGADTGADSGDTAAPVPELQIAIGATEWTLTLPSGAQTLSWSVASGLVVDDTTLLPPTVRAGQSASGASVTDVGEVTVWYGTFPDVATVDVSSGTLAGAWAFARDVGAVRVHVADDDWELVYYQ